MHSLDTARMDYCNILYHCLPKMLAKKLQRIQNIAAMIQTRAPSYDHVSHNLYSLHWLPVKARMKYKLLITTFKATHGMAPEYDLIQKYVPAYPLWSKSQGLLVQPEILLFAVVVFVVVVIVVVVVVVAVVIVVVLVVAVVVVVIEASKTIHHPCQRNLHLTTYAAKSNQDCEPCIIRG